MMMDITQWRLSPGDPGSWGDDNPLSQAFTPPDPGNMDPWEIHICTNGEICFLRQ